MVDPSAVAPRAHVERSRIAAGLLLTLVASGCASARDVSVQPFGPRFPATIWESIEIVPTAAAVQRTFVPLGLLSTSGTSSFLDEPTVARLQRAASSLGANAIVLEEVRSAASTDDPGPVTRAGPPSRTTWGGVATAIRIVDGRWGDRYWRYGPPPGVLRASPGDPGVVGGVLPPRRPPLEDERPGGVPAPRWERLVAWSGTGVQTTENFEVGAGEWRIVWEAGTGSAGELEILVYAVPGDVLTARIDQAGMTTGSYLGLAGAGTYYLQINGESSSWTIAIDAWSQP